LNFSGGIICSMEKTASCCIVVYGCAKNQVDAEEMAWRLKDAGFILTGDASEADLVIIHTCGFIDAAKKECIEGILRVCTVSEERLRRGLSAPRVIVTGCLSQRYAKELIDEIPEINGLAGTQAPRDIVEIARETLSGKKVIRVESPEKGFTWKRAERLVDFAVPWTYLRVSEGCRHKCTYCAIPSMRGPLVSRKMEDILVEAKFLSEKGIREVNLIAQDLGDYGLDLYGKPSLGELLERLSEETDLAWIRLLYVRPDGVTPELARAMKSPKVVPYIDLPVEHGSEKILRLMGRPGRDVIRKSVEALRTSVPEIAIRTTIITGFPGETEDDLNEIFRLLEEIRPHRVAVFPYSREEGTPAWHLSSQIDEKTKKERAESVRRFGLELAREHTRILVGKEIPVLLERPSRRSGYWLGRGPHQAPEVDGKVWVKARGKPGDIVKAQVTSAGYLDLFCRMSPA